MAGKSWLKIALCLMAIGSFGQISAGERTFEWIGEKYIGNWVRSETYRDGFSQWSTSVPTGDNAKMYVKAKVYLEAINWQNEGCHSERLTEINRVPATGGTVRKYVNSMQQRHPGTKETRYECGRGNVVINQNSCAGWGCGDDGPDTTHKSGRCGLKGTDVGTACTSNNSINKNCDRLTPKEARKYDQQCFMWRCKTTGPYEVNSCDYSRWENGGGGSCGERTLYCYQKTSSFKSADKGNWKTANEIGNNPAKEIYVYSYPTRVYIDYNGNGASQICGDGITANWEVGTNSGCNTGTGYNCNANLSIQYKDGNPVCKSNFRDGKMISATDNNSSTYISYSSGGKLRPNQYYKVGYDFKGWNTEKNGSGTWFKTDNMYITASNLSARPGERITLYAQWEKHSYKVSYSYNCGNIQDVTYKYGEGAVLGDLNTDSCKTNDANTTFLGWYEHLDENGEYTSKITKIPTSYYWDITLYARLRETRYFNYQTGNWEYTK